MKTINRYMKFVIIALISIVIAFIVYENKYSKESKIEVYNKNTSSGRNIIYGIDEKGNIILLDDKKLEFLKNSGVDIIENK